MARQARGSGSVPAAVGALFRSGLVVLPCRVFAGLRLVARRRFTWPSLGGRPQPSTEVRYLCSTAKLTR